VPQKEISRSCRPGRQVFDHECSARPAKVLVTVCLYSEESKFNVRIKASNVYSLFLHALVLWCFLSHMPAYSFITPPFSMANLTGLVPQYEATEYLTKLLPYLQMFLNYGIYNEISVSSQVQIFLLLSRFNYLYSYVWFVVFANPFLPTCLSS